jgi:hypothetical protein
VQSEVRWTKRCKDPALVGTIKEVIPQISHSKKWPKYRDGDGKWVNAYSLLQDRFFEGMKTAGFDGFERGERGSTAEHLSVEAFKVQQEKKRLADLQTQKTKAKAEVDQLVQATAVRADISATQEEIDAMAAPGKSGKNQIVANADWRRVSEMAKRCILLDAKMADMQTQITALTRDRDKWKANYERLWDEVKEFITAIRKIPNRLRSFIKAQRVDNSHNQEVSR